MDIISFFSLKPAFLLSVLPWLVHGEKSILTYIFTVMGYNAEFECLNLSLKMVKRTVVPGAQGVVVPALFNGEIVFAAVAFYTALTFTELIVVSCLYYISY